MNTPQQLAEWIAPAQLQAIQADYVSQLSALLSEPQAQIGQWLQKDRRFSGEAWRASQAGSHGLLAAFYLLNRQTLERLAESVKLEPKAQQKLRFMVQQWVEATSPANTFATNPEAIATLLASKGESLRKGIENLVQDMGKGRITQSDEAAFEVGKNLAITPGQVVLRTPYFELLQYSPTTDKVAARPLLMVPPVINKFYIMDLQPANSLVKFAVDSGHTVFLVSWKNADASLSNATWDDYVEEGVLKAIGAVLSITRQPDLNLLGFCVGGTLVSTALAVLQQRGEQKVHSLTLLTTLLDFNDAGVLDVFINEQHVSLREATLGKGGLMGGQELASTFSFLRPTDLLWNYVERNYLKGERPPAFDILFWNSDATNLPGPLFAWYLRNAYLENNLCRPNAVSLCGESIDLSTLDLPTYAFGAREDHIVPWGSALRSAAILGSETRFVLGASGHVAGTINPASKNKRSYWTGPTPAEQPEPEAWMAEAVEHPGSWWNDWADWLSHQTGGEVMARRRLGSGSGKASDPAPGQYVLVRAEDALKPRSA